VSFSVSLGALLLLLVALKSVGRIFIYLKEAKCRLEKSKIILTAHITPYEYQSTQRSHLPQVPPEPACGSQSGGL
jgi:hypothetical protein